MAKAEKITVELSRYDRQLLRQLIDAVGAANDSDSATNELPQGGIVFAGPARVQRPGLKRLIELMQMAVPQGEGDWQLQNDEKAGKDD